MSEEQLIATPSTFGETGNFLLERELGRGGMGGVYMGRDKMLDRPVAVKVMLKEYGSDPEFVEKFKKEAQACARLIHPNIAQIYSYNIYDGMPYIAMELVTGGSLFQIMQNTGANSDVPRVMKICEQVAQALRCAADQGLVHGDVKPENVLLDANGNAKLVDFGLAAMQKDTNEIWGTPYYIAPEKVKKEPVDYRADMYSLGGTIYHALCGVAPFEGADATAVVRKRFEGPAKKPSEVRPGLSPQVDYLVMKMLALDPKDRYPTFEALLADFKKVMTTGLNTTHVPSVPGSSARMATVAGGPKKLKLSTKRKATVTEPSLPDEGGSDMDSDEVQETPTTSGTRRLKIKPVARHRTIVSANGGEDAPAVQPADEGNVGGKVLMFVGIVIAVILAVAGLLVWVIHSRGAAADAKVANSISRGARQARESFEKTKGLALKFADDAQAMVDVTEAACVKHTEKMRDVLSSKYAQSVIDMLKPPFNDTLVKAIASTNVVVEAEAPAATNAAPASAAAAAVAGARGRARRERGTR